MHRIGAQYTNAQHWSQTATTAEKGTLCTGMQTKNNRTVKTLTEDERIEPNESMSESESIYYIKEIKNIVEQEKHYTAKVEINGTQREFIIDTGSPVTIMPLDERIMKTEIQKITNQNQDVNKNKV